MLKAKRKTYGNTWWGRAWIEALERIDSNRLARGKSYANTGKVLSLSVQAGRVTAKIKGSFYDSYQVRIELTPFTKPEIVRLQALVAQKSSVSIELGLGILPAALLDLLQKENLILLPSRWKDMKSSCSCPDSSNPCKHLAAVYYVLANEIDQDPFLLFNLKGVETAKLVGLSAANSQTLAEVRENPLLSKWVAPAALNSIPASPIPAAFNFALPRHNIRPVLSLLTENRVCCNMEAGSSKDSSFVSYCLLSGYAKQ
jgi:uncharacterized Zn finger protein